ncbi:MAG: hypothetical protein WCG27_07770 [Pseudomonadota bacterium]
MKKLFFLWVFIIGFSVTFKVLAEEIPAPTAASNAAVLAPTPSIVSGDQPVGVPSDVNGAPPAGEGYNAPRSSEFDSEEGNLEERGSFQQNRYRGDSEEEEGPGSSSYQGQVSNNYHQYSSDPYYYEEDEGLNGGGGGYN